MTYIKDYDTWRPFLRLLAYGCYHKGFVARRLHMSARSYEDNWARARRFLPADRLTVTRVGHREIHSLRGDSYQMQDNFLAHTYGLRSFTGKTAFYRLALLAAVQNADTPLSERELAEYALVPTDTELPAAIGDISRSTVHRQLQELAGLGLIEAVRRQGHTAYRAAANPLAGLMADEARLLYAAVCAYRQFARLAAPGCWLADTLRRLYPQALHEVPSSPLQLKHAAATRVLDDAVAAQLLDCITEQQPCTFTYRLSKVCRVLPLHLRTDFHTGRQYLLGLAASANHPDRYHMTQEYHLADITGLTVMPESRIEPPPPPRTAPPREIELRFHPDGSREAQSIVARLRERFPEPDVLRIESQAAPQDADAAIPAGRGTDAAPDASSAPVITARLRVRDPLTLVPWLRTLYPALEVPATEPQLRRRLLDDIKEALHHYE